LVRSPTSERCNQFVAAVPALHAARR
jgi:hypothetical protein